MNNNLGDCITLTELEKAYTRVYNEIILDLREKDAIRKIDSRYRSCPQDYELYQEVISLKLEYLRLFDTMLFNGESK